MSKEIPRTGGDQHQVTSRPTGCSTGNNLWMAEAASRGKLDRVLNLVVHPGSDPELIAELAQSESETRILVEGLQTIAEMTDPANFRVPGTESDLNHPPLRSIKPPKSLVRKRTTD